jgi:hypothetical protein
MNKISLCLILGIFLFSGCDGDSKKLSMVNQTNTAIYFQISG